FFQLSNVERRCSAGFFYVRFPGSFDVKRCGFITQAFRHQFHLQLVITDFKDNFFKEQVEDLLCGVVQGTQNDGRRQFTATVDTYEQVVLRIEFEVQPGTTVRDDARVIQHFTRRVGFTFVGVKEDARTTVQLGNDNTL